MLSLSSLKTLIISIIIVSILGYFVYQARHIILGPQLTIYEPQNGSDISSSTVKIIGNAQSINFISLDDRAIFVDERGNFEERVALFDGYNVIKITLRDKFGREKTQKLELTHKEPEENKIDLGNIGTTTATTTNTTPIMNRNE